MTTEQSNFIKTIGDAAVSYYPSYQILPSLTIAQAILESGWGKSGLTKDCYNYFGMKWSKGCGCDYKEYQTKEQNADGSYITITAKFRKYNSPEEGIKGYYDFLQYKRYQNIKGVTDYNLACDLIRQDGWATSLNYSKNLKKLIVDYNLTIYDDAAIKGTKVTSIQPVTQTVNKSEFPRGNYRVTCSALRVRTGPGINYQQKKFSQMTKSAQMLNPEYKKSGLAFYKKGILFTAQEVIKVSDSEYWARTPSGYVAMKYSGEVYVAKT